MSRIAPFISRTRQVIASARFTPFDQTTPEGRSAERYRRITITALASGMAKAVSLLTMLISVPLTLKYLDSDRYGLWITISSVTAMLSVADLGIGNGLITAIADAHGRHDATSVRQSISSAFALLFGIAVIVLLVFWICYPLVSWANLFNAHSPEGIREAGKMVAVLTCCYMAGIPFSIVSRVRAGFQEGFANSMWDGIASVASLIALLIAIRNHVGLVGLALATTAVPLVCLIINGLVLFARDHPQVRPRFRSVTRKAAASTLKTGFVFLALQMAIVVGFQSDNFVIDRILGPSQVAQYAVPMRLAMIVPMIVAFFLGPLWPAYGEAIARGDLPWARRTVIRSLQISLGICVPYVVIFATFGGSVIHQWVGPEIEASRPLMIGMALWVLCRGFVGPIAMFFNGLNVIKFQAITAILMATTNIVLSIILVRRIGVMGAVYGSVISEFSCVIIPSLWYLRNHPVIRGTARPANCDREGTVS